MRILPRLFQNKVFLDDLYETSEKGFNRVADDYNNLSPDSSDKERGRAKALLEYVGNLFRNVLNAQDQDNTNSY